MNVFVFQNRFEADIVAGRKSHTIRGHRRDGKPRAKMGETISLRVWTGKPYRSKQREIARGVVDKIESIAVHSNGISLGDGTLRVWFMGEWNHIEMLNGFARRDGFGSWSEMRDWFKATHGLPFSGSLVGWRLLP